MTATLTAEQKKLIRADAAGLREKIASGLEQIRRGETVDGKTVIQSLREKLPQRGRAGRWVSI